MCYNCGCKMKDDDMGDVRNVTLNDLAKDAAAKKAAGPTYLDQFNKWVTSLDPAELDQKIAEIKDTDQGKKITSENVDTLRLAQAAIASQMNGKDTISEVIYLLSQTTPAEFDQRVAKLQAA